MCGSNFYERPFEIFGCEIFLVNGQNNTTTKRPQTVLLFPEELQLSKSNATISVDMD